MSAIRVLLVPGLYDSGPEHWQSYWERDEPGFVRVEQSDWSTPVCADWVATLDAAVAAAGPDVVLAAHSLGCATVAHWAARSRQRCAGALLVAPSDVEAPRYPQGTVGFAPVPLALLPFPSIMVLSSDDEWITLERGRALAEAWGSRCVEIGEAGHINSASGLGVWAAGRTLLAELLPSA